MCAFILIAKSFQHYNNYSSTRRKNCTYTRYRKALTFRIDFGTTRSTPLGGARTCATDLTEVIGAIVFVLCHAIMCTVSFIVDHSPTSSSATFPDRRKKEKKKETNMFEYLQHIIVHYSSLLDYSSFNFDHSETFPKKKRSTRSQKKRKGNLQRTKSISFLYPLPA